MELVLYLFVMAGLLLWADRNKDDDE